MISVLLFHLYFNSVLRKEKYHITLFMGFGDRSTQACSYTTPVSQPLPLPPSVIFLLKNLPPSRKHYPIYTPLIHLSETWSDDTGLRA